MPWRDGSEWMSLQSLPSKAAAAQMYGSVWWRRLPVSFGSKSSSSSRSRRSGRNRLPGAGFPKLRPASHEILDRGAELLSQMLEGSDGEVR